MDKSADTKTAKAFASSWNNLPSGSVYTKEQFTEWLSPITASDIENKKVLELGCGNGSLLVHTANWNPALLTGVDLGDSIKSAKENTSALSTCPIDIIQQDMTAFQSEGFDLVYCIGVLHHLKNTYAGFLSVINNTKPGGKFHCWVYAKEGNWIVRVLVDPIRKITSHFPWWLTKYFLATPLSLLYFVYAHAIVFLKLKFMPLYQYSAWITKRNFLFFRHVAFDQLVSPQTAYIQKSTIEKWLQSDARIDQNSTYLIFRNGNSWKFGGQKK